MTAVYETGPIGEAPCPACKRTVMFAWDDDMNPVALDADDRGLIAVAEDPNHIPWCRPVGPTEQLTLDDRLFRLHDPHCPALAPVIPIGRARKPRRRRRQPVTGGRRASAR